MARNALLLIAILPMIVLLVSERRSRTKINISLLRRALVAVLSTGLLAGGLSYGLSFGASALEMVMYRDEMEDPASGEVIPFEITNVHCEGEIEALDTAKGELTLRTKDGMNGQDLRIKLRLKSDTAFYDMQTGGSFSAGELAVGQKIKAGTEVFHDGEGAEIQVTAYAVYRNMQDMQVPEYVVVRKVSEKDGGVALLDSSGFTWNLRRETELRTYGRDETVSLDTLKEGQRCLIFPDIEASAKLSETQVAGQSVLVLP